MFVSPMAVCSNSVAYSEYLTFCYFATYTKMSFTITVQITLPNKPWICCHLWPHLHAYPDFKTNNSFWLVFIPSFTQLTAMWLLTVPTYHRANAALLFRPNNLRLAMHSQCCWLLSLLAFYQPQAPSPRTLLPQPPSLTNPSTHLLIIRNCLLGLQKWSSFFIYPVPPFFCWCIPIRAGISRGQTI